MARARKFRQKECITCAETQWRIARRRHWDIHAHIGRSRRVLEDELNSRRVTWLKNEARAILEANLGKFHAALRKGPVLPAKGDGDPGAVQVGEVRRKEKKAAAESDSRERGSSDSSSTSVDRKRKLKKLREDLAEAEKEKAEKKGKKHQPARRARRKEKKDVEKGKERKKSERKARGRSKDRKRRKSRKRSKSPASEAEKSKDEKKRRKRRQESKSSSSTRSKGEAVVCARAGGAWAVPCGFREDLTSCFNLFRLPRKWASYLCFSKKVDGRVFGLAPGRQVYAGLTVVPMGWINSVAVIQCAVRRLVFGLSKVPESSEVSKLKRFPNEDSVSLVYLDSFDEIRRMDRAYAEVVEGKMSERHRNFVETCNRLRLPLNEGKRLVGAVRGIMQGGLLDGERGTFAASPDKLQSLMGLGCALLASRTSTEYELRHFVGKALFCLAFRRTAFCILESVFYDIEHLARGGEFLSRESVDEVILVLALLPVLRMNLRAKWDREVCITDASPTGGGAAVAREFKPPPDTEHHDRALCKQCGSALTGDNQLPCPAGCGVAVCSWECANDHRSTVCKRKLYPVPKFGERFSGKNAPLGRAVARSGGVEVQVPFDLLLGSDFFSTEGREKLKGLQEDPLLAAEHWAPECKLFSRARGRPITLPDGRVIKGPQPVRDGAHVMGFSYLGAEMKARLRRSNKMALASLQRCDVNDHNDIITTVEHPYNSWLWSFKPAEQLTEANYTFAVGSMCCFGGRREKWFAVLNNSNEIQYELEKLVCPGHEGLLPYTVQVGQDGQLVFDTEEEAEYPDGFCEAYAKGLKQACKTEDGLSGQFVKAV